jgi:hypothetical protein
MRKRKHIALLATLMCFTLAGASMRPRATATARTNVAAEWFFVVIETHVNAKNVETNDQHPEERRWYVSNVAALPESIPSYSAPKKVMNTSTGT